jgi:UDP-3-O-[3-hydroxymyristoyl] glucosamine N-acyltransferase
VVLNDLLQLIQGTLYGEASYSQNLTGLASLKQAEPGQVSFLFDEKFASLAETTRASLLITKKPLKEDTAYHGLQVIHPDPLEALRLLSPIFNPDQRSEPFCGVSPLAQIHPKAQVHPEATIYPFVVIEEGAQVGARTVIYPQGYIGPFCQVGSDCLLHPRVSLIKNTILGDRVEVKSGAVLGEEGFGYSPNQAGELKKNPQEGSLMIEDDVHIGANTTIDRGTFDATRIQKGSKIDAQVHIGHNVTVGPWSILCGQVGIAGSATLGPRVIAAGQVGISQGVSVVSGAILGASCGVMVDIKEPGEYLGTPAQPAKTWKRELVYQKKIKTILEELAQLKAQLGS